MQLVRVRARMNFVLYYQYLSLINDYYYICPVVLSP
jgi:hypothetical protein